MVLWHVCKMDEGVIYTEESKKAALKQARLLKIDAQPRTQKAGKGCYEVLGEANQPICIWLVRDDCLEAHGFSRPTIEVGQ